MKDAISAIELQRLLDEGARIKVYDVRKIHDRVDVEYPVPTAQWRDPEKVSQWRRDIGDADEVIVFCVHGHQVSQSTRDVLRERGIRAHILEGGIEAWLDYARSRKPTRSGTP
jgi:rhodanese-related sulfurtransferase